MNNEKNILISKKYANSLLSLALEGKIGIDKIKENLSDIKEILSNSSDLFDVLTNPIISNNDKQEISKLVFERDLDDYLKNFIQLLIEKGRFNLIYNIIDAFDVLVDKVKNITRIEITSAIDLEIEKKQQIKERLEKKLNKELKIAYFVDNSIIAGLIFKIDDNVLDTSLNHKLEELKKEIIK